jgi:hypothetical protein
MKTAAALDIASTACLRQSPAKRRAAGKSRPVRCDGPGPPGALVWCVHCYQILGIVGSRRQRLKLERVHHCSDQLLAKLPASPPPYN